MKIKNAAQCAAFLLDVQLQEAGHENSCSEAVYPEGYNV